MKKLFCLLTCAVALTAQPAPLGILFPAYLYPVPGAWDPLTNAAAKVPLIVIVNPNNGPGSSPDPNYVAAVNLIRSAGAKAYGYVYSSYAARPLAQIQTDVDMFLSFYPLDGFFVDEMTNDSDTNHLNYYAALYQYIKGRNANLPVMGNPGTTTLETYLNRPTVDSLLIFENGTGYDSFTPPGWVTNHLARQFANIAYNVGSAATMSNYVSLAASRNAGWVFFTDATGANPYDRLPGYWTNEVALIQSLNQNAQVTTLKMLGVTNQIPSLQISGAPGTYEIQTTTNLSNWVATQMVNVPTNILTFTDTPATNSATCFYRSAQ